MKVKEIAQLLNAIKVIGDENTEVSTLSSIENIIENSVFCVSNDKYLDTAINSNANVIVIKEQLIDSIKNYNNKVFIIHKNPKEAFIKLLYFLFEDKKYELGIIKESAIIDKSASLDKNIYIADNVYIGKNTKISNGTIIEANVFIGDNVVIGENCKIYANVSIQENSIINNNVIIGSGTVIGNDGFGFVEVEGKQVKIPQRGNVVIEDNVEIGANVCIDRATLGSTIIRSGVKIDNLVQIAHNCDIGEHSIIVSQVGIAGSSKIGHHCILAGQVGLADHVTLGDRVVLGGQSGVMSNVKIESNSTMLGSPAEDINKEMIKLIASKKLPELIEFIEKKFEVKFKRK